MLSIWVDKSINKIRIQTTDPSVKFLLETTREETKFIPWQKKWGTLRTTTKIYDEKKLKPDINGFWNFTIGLGWAGYVLGIFQSHITKEEYNGILKDAIYASDVRTLPFPNLRDYQNEDVLHILKYKTGLLCCYTSYGKTSVIATLANYFYSLGKSVLLVTPGNKAKDELIKRCKSVFNLDVPSNDLRINSVITSGLMNRNDVKDPDKLKDLENLWGSYQVVLVDEVEYTVGSDSGEFLYDRLTGFERLYGFSGTADKTSGECISFKDGLSEIVIRNKYLVKHFGPSIVFRMPLRIDIDLVKIRTDALCSIKFSKDDFGEDTNRYNAIMNRIWKTPELIEVIIKTIKKFPLTYIPVYNLNGIILDWVENYFKGKLRVLLICGEGYIYYDLDGNRTNLKSLETACEYVKNGMVDVIPSTSSGYRALDLPGLENIILIQGKVAGVTLQSIGRVARGKHMNIISFEPSINKKVPVYSKGLEERDEMIRTYYKYCNIKEYEISEINL